MKRLSLILITAIAATFVCPTVNAAVKPVKDAVKPVASFTVVGYLIEGDYVFTFYIDPSTANPHPIAGISVQRLSDGLSLDTNTVSGFVSVGIHSIIVGTATISFNDAQGNLVTQEFTGGLLGGVVGVL